MRQSLRKRSAPAIRGVRAPSSARAPATSSGCASSPSAPCIARDSRSNASGSAYTRIEPEGRCPTSMPVASASAAVHPAYIARLRKQSCVSGPVSCASTYAPRMPAAALDASAPG